MIVQRKTNKIDVFDRKWISFLISVAIAPIVVVRMILKTGLNNVLMVLGLIVAGLWYITSLIAALLRRVLLGVMMLRRKR
jgi:uncharacterized membrane protein YgaE (UPF0421/DUF939 family)